MQIFAGFAGEGALKWRFFASFVQSSEHFTYMATRQLSGDTTVNDLEHCKVIGLFHIKFLKNGV